MVITVVGSGGKTTLIRKLAREYRAQGKSVLITTTTRMFIEPDTLLTDDASSIISVLNQTGYAMAGIPEGPKIRALSEETYAQVCAHADIVLVEADGSKHMPLKFPNATEPVIPGHTDEIIVVCGRIAIGRPAREVCHRLPLVKECLGIDDDTVITEYHVKTLVERGYLHPLREEFPGKKLTLAERLPDADAAYRFTSVP